MTTNVTSRKETVDAVSFQLITNEIPKDITTIVELTKTVDTLRPIAVSMVCKLLEEK